MALVWPVETVMVARDELAPTVEELIVMFVPVAKLKLVSGAARLVAEPLAATVTVTLPLQAGTEQESETPILAVVVETRTPLPLTRETAPELGSKLKVVKPELAAAIWPSAPCRGIVTVPVSALARVATATGARTNIAARHG